MTNLEVGLTVVGTILLTIAIRMSATWVREVWDNYVLRRELLKMKALLEKAYESPEGREAVVRSGHLHGSSVGFVAGGEVGPDKGGYFVPYDVAKTYGKSPFEALNSPSLKVDLGSDEEVSHDVMQLCEFDENGKRRVVNEVEIGGSIFPEEDHGVRTLNCRDTPEVSNLIHINKHNDRHNLGRDYTLSFDYPGFTFKVDANRYIQKGDILELESFSNTQKFEVTYCNTTYPNKHSIRVKEFSVDATLSLFRRDGDTQLDIPAYSGKVVNESLTVVSITMEMYSKLSPKVGDTLIEREDGVHKRYIITDIDFYVETSVELYVERV